MVTKGSPLILGTEAGYGVRPLAQTIQFEHALCKYRDRLRLNQDFVPADTRAPVFN